MNIPQSITQGDTATWQDDPWISPSGRLYSAPDYTLSYVLRGPAGGVVLVATASGNGWQTALSAAQSAALAVGRLWWSAVVEGEGERVTIASGEVLVGENLAANPAAAYDGRTQAERDLDAVNAAISARTSGGLVAEYSVAGRSLKREPMAALLALRSALMMRVRNEQTAASIAAGLGNPRNLHVRFR